MTQALPFPATVKRELRRNADLYSPLRVLSVELGPQKARTLQLGWNNRRETFVTELKARSAPKVVQEGIRILKESSAKGKNRLLILPYLSGAVIELIQPEGISGLDLSGNYFIQTKNLLAIRLDQPNRYKESQPIKAIYSGNSSIVGRFLLAEKKTYDSVNAVFFAIRKNGGWGGNESIAISTVSKVLKSLEEDLIIEKVPGKIRLIQPDKLLDNLRNAYKPPRVTDELKLKLPDGMRPWKLGLTGINAFSGESSAQKYATTTDPTVYTMYVADIPYLLKAVNLAKYEEVRFPNLILKETRDAFVYFKDDRFTGPWASPIQTYLELSKLDKREREIAEDVRKVILEPFT